MRGTPLAACPHASLLQENADEAYESRFPQALILCPVAWSRFVDGNSGRLLAHRQAELYSAGAVYADVTEARNVTDRESSPACGSG
jgi:hypothetical protein